MDEELAAGRGIALAAARGGRLQHEQDDNAYSGVQHNPLRTSLSMMSDDAGSASLHASQRLQSTPAKSAAAGHGHLHRVYRSSSRPVTVSSSATPTDSSVSLYSAGGDEDTEEEDAVDHLDAMNNNNINNNPAARDYWNRIILDIENNEADMPSMARPASSLSPPSLSSRQTYLTSTARNAPSTGSSTTLVEQDSRQSNAIQNIASSSSRSPRTSPPGNHASRFAAAVSYAAELEESQRELSSNNNNSSNSNSMNRSLTPQPHSFQQHPSDASTAPAHEGVSDAASRVHDIFRRHIHNASTSYTSRRSSLNNTATRDSVSKTVQPRQRLRDLLAVSVSESEADNVHVPRERRNTSRDGRVVAASTSTRRSLPTDNPRLFPVSYYTSQSPQQEPHHALTSSGRNPILDTHDVAKHSYDTSHSNQSRPQIHHSQSWDDVSRRSMNEDRSRRTPVNAGVQSETEEESVNDADVEDQQPEMQATHPSASQRPYASSKYARNPSVQSPFSASDKEDEDEEEDDLSLLLGDVTPEEYEHLAHMPANASRTPQSQAVQASPARQTSSQRKSSSPALARTSPSPQVHTSPSPRRIIRQSHSLFQNQAAPSTPPKTPRLPGHYLSTTPFIGQTPAASLNTTSRHADDTRLDADDRSRLMGNSTLMLPSIPGGYSSPFPHPRQLSAKETEGTSEPRMANGVSPPPLIEERRKSDRFSSMLHRVIEEADAEHRSASESPSRRSALVSPEKSLGKDLNRTVLSPSGRDSVKNSVNDVNASTHEAVPSALSSSFGAAEQTLQTLLVDLVKPLKGLIGGFNAPSSPLGIPDAPMQDDSEATMVSNQSFELRLKERRKRRSEQDAALRQLQEADLLDHTLANRAEELKHTLEDMGNQFTTQVTSVLNETFARENRRRKLWFLFLMLAELSLLWGLLSFANARAKLLYQTTYYDPFSPELYDLSPPPHIASLYSPSFSSASLSSTSDVNRQSISWSFSKMIPTLFRISPNSFASLLPFGTTRIPNYENMSMSSRQYTLSEVGLGIYVQQFVDVIRSIYYHLLGLGIGNAGFVHGTLAGAGGVVTSGTSSTIYRVPT